MRCRSHRSLLLTSVFLGVLTPLSDGVIYGQPIATPAPPAAQPTPATPANIPSSDPRIFADFPKVATDGPFLPPVWPERWGFEHAYGTVIEMKNPAVMMQGVRLGGTSADISTQQEDVAAILAGREPELPFHWRLEGRGGFAFEDALVDETKPTPKGRRNTASSMLRFVSAQITRNVNDATLSVERTWFSVYEPIGADAKAAAPALRGVALISPGLLGTPMGTMNALATLLRRDGWLVVRMMAQPSRFTQDITFELDAAGDVAAQAAFIAKELDGRAAECAYSVEGVLGHLEEKRPELKGLPRVAIGFSGGAITLPTIMAREPARYRAAVLVGGGADFWLMNQRSNYRELIDAMHEKWAGGKPTPEALAALDAAYLNVASLDSYHTAAAMKGVKTLMIQGNSDLAVPSPLGDVLWERLGRPERWIDEGAGHETLFMDMTREYFPKVAEWLREAVPAAGAVAAPETRP